MGTFDNLYSTLDADPKKRGLQFEHVCKWYLENNPIYASQLSKVWLWKQWPDRPTDADTGIDLVARDTEGNLWAIQAKAYAQDRAIPKSELDKFLSASNTAVFSHRLLISTSAKGLHHHAQRTVDAQDKPVTTVELHDLRAADDYLEWPTSLSNLRPSTPSEPATIREHQEAAVADVIKGFQSSDRGQLIMACGTGKTLAALFTKEKLKSRRTLVLVPSLSLLKQTMHEWVRHRRDDFDVLPVCSDDTVRRDDDSAMAHVSGLGIPSTTDPVRIAEFLRKRGPRVVFATYHSSPDIAKAFTQGRVPRFDLVVADEAHRCAGPESDFTTVLDAVEIKSDKRLFMTATPRVFSTAAKKQAQDAEIDVYSMDDVTKFGPVFHTLGFTDAISRGLLTDYRVLVVGVDDAMCRKWVDAGALVSIDGKTATDARTLAAHVGLAKAVRKYNLRRTLTFHSRVSGARDFAAMFPEVVSWMPARQRPKGTPWCAHASGDMSAGERGQLLDRLRAVSDEEYGLLSNARCLSEGVDVPALDGVAFVDPKSSEIDIVQAVGRAIRNSPDKTAGTIVIPVFIDTDADAETTLSGSSFEPVWKVVKALRSHDEELGFQIDALRRSLGRANGKRELPGKIEFDLPTTVSQEFATAFKTRVVMQTASLWNVGIAEVRAFAAEHGHAMVPINYVSAEEHRTGVWAASRRDEYTNGKLSADRIAELEAITGWVWNVLDQRWIDGVTAVRNFADKHRHARIPLIYVSADGHRTGAWVTRRRGDYGTGKLSADRIAELESIPGWVWNTRDTKWLDGLAAVRAYAAEHGHASVPGDYVSTEGHRTGSWTLRQRSDYASGTLSGERVADLETIPGWTWSVQDQWWIDGITAVRKFADEHKHTMVPTSYISPDGHKTGDWVRNRRGAYVAGKLTPDRIAELEAFPGWAWNWDNVLDQKWLDGVAAVRNFSTVQGHARVPCYYISPDRHRTGRWVSSRRTDYVAGKLTPDRIAELEAIPGWVWSVLDQKWLDGVTSVRNFVAVHGNAFIPQYYVSPSGHRTGEWVQDLRSEYKARRLSQDRIAELESVPGWTWNTRDTKWSEGLAAVRAYAEENVHAVPRNYVSPNGHKTGAWVRHRRGDYAAGRLTPKRIADLETIPGWAWKNAPNSVRATPCGAQPMRSVPPGLILPVNYS